MNKLEFCRFQNDVLNDSYDQHLKMTGIINENNRKLFKASINEWKNNLRSQEPILNLQLAYAFGIETTHKNQTLAMLQSKKIMYFIGKIIVIFHIQSNSQEFYRGHKYRVTCFSVLPDKKRVASGEAAYRPIINIWSVNTLQTLLIIQTDHIGGIIDLAVQGNIIVSFGFREKNMNEQGEMQQYLYSLQVFDYQHNQCLAYRPQKDLSYVIAIDPTNNLRFVTCNQGSISFWEVSANRIIRRSLCIIDQDTPTACIYYTGSQGLKKQPDLIVGTLSGAIGVVSRERYWWVFRKGDKQSKQINCLLVVNREQQSLILASSDDGLLRCWNTQFEQRFKYDFLKQNQHQESKNSQNRLKQGYNKSLQSLCLVDPQKLKAMGARRNSQIVYLDIKLGEKGKQIIQNPINKFSGRFTEKGKGKVLISHHPRLDVIATLGQDHVVMFWSCDQNTILLSKQLGLDIEKTQPTALKFSPNGDFLLVGFSDGLLVYLDSKMTKGGSSKSDGKYSGPTLTEITKQTAQENFAVVGIQFSQNSDYLAVSYHYLQYRRSIAMVKIFVTKAKMQKTYRPNKLQHQKIYELHCVVDNHNDENGYQKILGKNCGYAVCSMSFAEYQGGHYLLMYFDLLNQNQNKVCIKQKELGKFKIHHVNNKTDHSISDHLIKWRKPPIHRALTAHYLFQTNLFQKLSANNHLRIPQFTNSVFLDRHLIIASQNGDLHLLRAGMIEESSSIAKTLPAHGCIVNQIEYNHDRSYIYTTGQNDNCILKWKVEGINLAAFEQQGDQSSLDIFGEIPEPEQLEKRLERYDFKFKAMGIGAKIPGFIQQVRVKEIIGRTSYYQRNNLKVDSKGRVLYYSGQAIIAANLQTKSKEFLYLTQDRKIVEEVSVIEISQEGDIVAVAYSGRKAQIVLWALSSKIILSRIYLEDILQVIYMTFSYDHSRLLLYGLRGLKAEGCIILIDLINLKILATVTYLHKQSWHIKGLTFLPYSCDRFYTCGVQPVKQWYYHSGQLVYKFLYSKSQSQTNSVHTSLAFADDTLITGTDAGHLVVWNETALSYTGHQQMVTCLSVSKPRKNGVLVVSGSQARLEGQNFQIILWSYSGGILQELRKISANCDKFDNQLLGSRVHSNFQAGLEVQSLAFWQNQIYIGLLKGDIFTFDYQVQQKRQIYKADHVMCFQDAQKTQSLFFTNNHQQLVEISEHGLFRIWNFLGSILIWSKHFEAQVVNMVFCSIYQLVIVAFRGQLRFFEWGSDRRSLQEREQKMVPFNFLSHLVLSQNQQTLALGIQSNSDKSHIIQVYDITDKQFKFKLKLTLKSPISYIDFSKLSTDKTLMLVKTEQKIEVYDVTTKNVFEISGETAKKIDWLGRGLEIAEKTEIARGIHRQIEGEDVNIRKIAEVGRSILIADSAGHVIMVTDDQLTGKCKMGMSSIDFAALSPSGRWCALVSKQDRNIVILQLLTEN